MTWSTIKTPDFEAPIALHHGDGSCTVVALNAWYGALTMARWGGWKPEGTTLASGASQYRYGYLPVLRGRVHVAEEGDVRKLAKGLRKALERSAGLSTYERGVARVELELHGRQPGRPRPLFSNVTGTSWGNGFAGEAAQEVVHVPDTLPWLAYPRNCTTLEQGETHTFAFPYALRTSHHPDVAAEYARLADRLEAGGTARISGELPAGWFPPNTATVWVEVIADVPRNICGVTRAKGDRIEVPVSEAGFLGRSGVVRELNADGTPKSVCCPHCGHHGAAASAGAGLMP